jgi:ubiquinone/menaquinone biosynthesis C-methylase UbiE
LKTRLGAERFEEAEKYAEFLRTPEGRLRTDLSWANLRDFLHFPLRCRVVDVGGGTGTLAMRMAEMGFDVELLDVSAAMLALARNEADARELTGRIRFHRGDASQLPDLFQPASFDAVICHNALEYVDDPFAVVGNLASLLKRDGKAVVSLLVRNRWGEVLKAAIKGRDPERARTALRADTVLESLYGEPVRLFDPDDFRKMVERAGFEPLAVRGVRVLSDYTDCEALTEAAYKRLIDFELLIGAQPQLAGIARYTQVIARRTGVRQDEGS